ncbi:MAG: hypothetical protein K6V36_05670 [Anaerolineae bacterium]|nr:hypothetical protein [Anaerolineae bacterium]
MNKLFASWVMVALLCSGLLSCDRPPSAATSGREGQTAAEVKAAKVKQGDRLTAAEAYQFVLPKVKEWDPRATIALCEVPVRSKADDLDLDGRSSAWTFVCASADQQSYKRFAIDTTKDTLEVKVSNSTRPAVDALVDPATWKVDSPQALEIAQANGLAKWLEEHPKFTLDAGAIDLRASKDMGSYWRIYARDVGPALVFRISAVDGKVLTSGEQ